MKQGEATKTRSPRLRIPLFPALALSAALASHTAGATIEGAIQSCGFNWGGNTVHLARGVANDVTVTGFGVDLATSVDTSVPGLDVKVLSRKNWDKSNIVLRITPPRFGRSVSRASVNLRYFGGGVDTFLVNIDSGPQVSSVALVPGGGVSTTGGTTRVTSQDPHVFVIKGAYLDDMDLDWDVPGGNGLLESRVVLRIPGELHVSFRSAAGERTIDSSLFRGVSRPLGSCSLGVPYFALGFTVYDPPRTPTPTATPTATPTPTPNPIRPIAPPTGIRTPAFPTPTPTPKPLQPIAPPKPLG